MDLEIEHSIVSTDASPKNLHVCGDEGAEVCVIKTNTTPCAGVEETTTEMPLLELSSDTISR